MLVCNSIVHSGNGYLFDLDNSIARGCTVHIICTFVFAAAGSELLPRLQAGSTGYLAQFPSIARGVPHSGPAKVNYPRQVPRETLDPYVPLPPFREPGMF